MLPNARPTCAANTSDNVLTRVDPLLKFIMLHKMTTVVRTVSTQLKEIHLVYKFV